MPSRAGAGGNMVYSYKNLPDKDAHSRCSSVLKNNPQQRGQPEPRLAHLIYDLLIGPIGILTRQRNWPSAFWPLSSLNLRWLADLDTRKGPMGKGHDFRRP